MEQLATITAADGELMPSKVVSKHDVTLNPVILQAKSTPSKSVKSSKQNESDEEEESSSSSSSEEGFFVEFELVCANDDGEHDNKPVVFNFETEENYMEHAETGFDDLDGYFGDAVNANFPGWSYADEWEERQMYGNELPEDYEGDIVTVY